MTTRRLAAILAADVAGFSAMMERDEEGTAARIRSLRAEVIEPALTKHHGRLVKTTGDGFLAEFASPVEAVRSALAIQEQLAAANGVSLRIGINLGDIIIEDDGDVLGDGVNVAARLEQMADPGGICISDEVHRHVAGKIDRVFEDRGEQQVKNIARTVRVFALAGQRVSPGEPKSLPLPDKPSIAVLPFTNISDDRETDWFADGVVEEIITGLGRVRWLFVIARNSSFTYKGRAVDVRHVGRELGVRYVLEGSIRRAGKRVRITGQLIEAATGNQIWAERFEGTLEDIFNLQDEMTEGIVGALEPSLRAAEIERARAKPTSSLDAYDLYLRALAELHAFTAMSVERANELFEAALDRDPQFAEAWAGLAECVGRSGLNGWIDDVEAAAQQSCAAARKAIAADPKNGPVLAVAAWALAVMGGHAEEAVGYAERALELAPNSATALVQCGWVLVYSADAEGAKACLRRALRLNPLDPNRFQAMAAMAAAHYFAGEYDDTIRIAQRTITEKPATSSAWRFLAAAHAQKGALAEASRVVSGLLEHQPSSTLARTAKTSKFRFAWMTERYLEGLRLAGLPR